MCNMFLPLLGWRYFLSLLARYIICLYYYVSLKLAVAFNVTFALRDRKIDSDFKIILFQSK